METKIDDLIIRFLDKKTTKDEALELLEWIEASEENRRYFSTVHSVWTMIQLETTEYTDPEQIKIILNNSIKANSPFKKNTMRWWKNAVAAACVILLSLGVWIWLMPEDNSIDYHSIMTNLPQGDDITITINPLEKTKKAENRIITLDDSIARLNHTGIAGVTINDTLNIEEATLALNTVRVPYGKRMILLLEDSTTIYLNSGSTLIYPSVFADNKREVYLDGEAYFEVKRDPERKFIVQTTIKPVEVLGTIFNVSVDEEHDFFETVLVNGSIALNTKEEKIKLTQNQRYYYIPSTQEESIEEVDVSNYISWIDGKLKFKKEPMFRAIQKLEKVYNVKIELTDPECANRFVSGELNLQDSVEETMTFLLSTLVPEEKQKVRSLFTILPN
ncbi:FecR domain-containing protein [Massilibacteroides sp.]|uniref:FecR family protein n=1 Tax=Massilibacteroides sp. TaxID=2034766 RepID=UPI002630D817|nr:FecR domain-containing protein [Massilibacteroides sp.]MDD4516294.1 FecR domain-containing protein [Massilibacteroides sp.]